MDNQKKSRRAFLNLINKKEEGKNTETVKMLTPDGQLVEVKRKNNASQKPKKKDTSNKDILNWIKSNK